MEELFLRCFFRGLVSKKKDFIIKDSQKEAFNKEDRQKIVGLVPIDKKSIFQKDHI